MRMDLRGAPTHCTARINIRACKQLGPNERALASQSFEAIKLWRHGRCSTLNDVETRLLQEDLARAHCSGHTILAQDTGSVVFVSTTALVAPQCVLVPRYPNQCQHVARPLLVRRPTAIDKQICASYIARGVRSEKDDGALCEHHHLIMSTNRNGSNE